MQNQLTTYLRAGYPGLAVISSEEARAEAEIAAACSSLKRQLLAWSSTDDPVILAPLENHLKALFQADSRILLAMGCFVAGRNTPAFHTDWRTPVPFGN